MQKDGQNREEKCPPVKEPSEPSEADSEDKYFDKIKGFRNKISMKGAKQGLKTTWGIKVIKTILPKE